MCLAHQFRGGETILHPRDHWLQKTSQHHGFVKKNLATLTLIFESDVMLTTRAIELLLAPRFPRLNDGLNVA